MNISGTHQARAQGEWAGAAGRRAVCVYTGAAALCLGLVYARYLWMMAHTRNVCFGRVYDMFIGLIDSRYWPETIGGGHEFFVKPLYDLVIAGPVTNINLMFPVLQGLGPGWPTVFASCMALYAVNAAGAYYVLKTGFEKKIPAVATLAAASIIVLNPFFLLKISWDPILSFGMLTVPLAYWLQFREKRNAWMVVMIVSGLYHPINTITICVWLLWEIFLGDRAIRKHAGTALVVLSVYFAAKSGFLYVENHLHHETSWIYNTFGNALGADLVSVARRGDPYSIARLLASNFKELLMAMSLCCFGLCVSKKFLVILAVELAYIVVGIDASGNGAITVWAGIMAVGVIDAYSGGASALDLVRNRTARGAAALAGIVCGVALLAHFHRVVPEGTPSFAKPFYTVVAQGSEPGGEGYRKAVRHIRGRGVCVTNAPLAAPVSLHCARTFSFNALFPYDISLGQHLPSRRGIDFDWMLVDLDDLGAVSPGVSVSKQPAVEIPAYIDQVIRGVDMHPVYFDGRFALLRKSRGRAAPDRAGAALKAEISGALRDRWLRGKNTSGD